MRLKTASGISKGFGAFPANRSRQPFLVIVDYAHYRRCTGESDSNGARVESQGPDQSRCLAAAAKRTGPSDPVMGEVTGRLSDLNHSFQRPIRATRPAENYQRHYCGTPENRRKISDRAGPEKAIGMAMEEARQRRYRVAGRKGSRELSDYRGQDV